MRKNSNKNESINAAVRRELSRILREEVKDPRIPVVISVVNAQVAPDLKTCKAYVSVFGDEKTVRDCHAALKSASGFIRYQLAHSLNLRHTPEITYIMDQSIEYGVSMSRRIDEVMEEQNQRIAERGEDPFSEEDPASADSVPGKGER
ncbi:MAG: 30S ribosome-binding factor RbfA [Lachnospiraceae bacterium]|nr:30S ribosome-binding factor RbfA [Lachnospiraceae bacterium]